MRFAHNPMSQKQGMGHTYFGFFLAPGHFELALKT